MKQDRFSLLTKSVKEIFALDKGKFKAQPPMTTPVKKRNQENFCEFHDEVGHNTDEYMHLRKQIKEMLKAGKLSHLIKELKQINRKEQPKVAKKEETYGKDKALAILMEDEGAEGPIIIEVEIGGHSTTPLIGFSGEIIWPIGQIQLLVKTRDEQHSALAWMNFMVVRSSSSYNGIIGRTGVKKLQAFSSTTHEMLKILVEGGVIIVKNRKPQQVVCTTLAQLGHFHLEAYRYDKHRLNMRVGYSSVRQKKRGQAVDRNQSIQEEVGKLMEAGIMKEVHYHDWVSNPLMVKKQDDSWWMCVDFKYLNKACLKDGYSLSEIDWKEDEEKTTFITSQGIFCHTKMPFGLRNAGATYQCLVDKAFHKQIGRNLEVYVDDIVIKSRMKDETVKDIKETFKTLREINRKLNPKKCTFGVEEGMFLGYKVNAKGLKVCPDKVNVVLRLPSIKCLKDV
nr:hypothetical protein [Tanacetum cinerariifolium]